MPFPPPGNLPNSGMEPESLLMSPALAGRFLTPSDIWEALHFTINSSREETSEKFKYIYISNGDGLFVKISHDLHYDFIMR